MSTAVSTSATWTSPTFSNDPLAIHEFHAMTTLADGTVVMHGGRVNDAGHNRSFNDAWLLNMTGTEPKWALLAPSESVPDAHHGHALTTLVDGTVVMFGGRRSSTTSFFCRRLTRTLLGRSKLHLPTLRGPTTGMA